MATTKNSKRETALKHTTEWARRRLERDTLEEQRSGKDFFETSVWAVRELIEKAFAAGEAAAKGGLPAFLDLDEDEMLETLEVNKHKCRSCGGAWVSGSMAGHAFDALVFPESSEYDIEPGSRISKLSLKDLATGTMVANYDRGWDINPTTKAAAKVVGLLAAGLADTVLSN